MIEITGAKKLWNNTTNLIAEGSPEDFKCSRCNKELNEGYLCKERGLVLCKDCETKMWEQPVMDNGTKGPSEIIKNCPHNAEGVHYHIKWYKSEENKD